MNPQMFSVWGYLSVALWLAVPVLWGLHLRRRTPRGWLCHVALGVALLAYALAKVNSLAHVNRIQLDQSAEIAAAKAKAEAARKTAQQARNDQVAQVRFAEDSAHDSMDAGGMDSADMKYMEKINEAAEPAWKKVKKQRSGGAEADDSVEAAIEGQKAPAGDAPAAGPESKGVEEGGGRPPVLMVEKDKALANRLDALNLAMVRLLVLLGVVILVVDYLRRANRYGEAYLPLPLPGAWMNALTPLPAFVARPEPARRSVAAELAWLTRRGDVFAYLTSDPAAAAAVPGRLARLPRGRWPVEVLHVAEDDGLADDTFMFETLWYHRASFVMNSVERADAFLESVVRLLRRRMEKRAKVRQAVHIVWDMGRPVPDSMRAELEPLARVTGWSLMEVEATAADSKRQTLT